MNSIINMKPGESITISESLFNDMMDALNNFAKQSNDAKWLKGCVQEELLEFKSKIKTCSYRPFMDSAELILEWDKKLGDISVLGAPLEPCSLQEPFIWVKHKVDDRRRLIVGFGENFVELGNKAKPVTMQSLFEMYTFLDGTPCGVKEK